MADIDLKTATPDTSLPTTGFLFGADSQASASPSVYSTQTVATTLLGSTSLTGATITTSQPVLDLAQTWNASGVTFTGLRFNATDTASAAGSLLMDLQVGGASRFNVGKTGSLKLGVNPTGTNQAGTNVTIAGSQGTGTGAGGSIVFQVAPAGSSGTAQNALVDVLQIGNGASDARAFVLKSTTTNFVFNTNLFGASPNTQMSITAGGQGVFFITPDGFTVSGEKHIAFSANLNSSSDVFLRRDTSNTLALRNGTNPQTFNVYNTFTSSTNFERYSVDWITTSNLVIVGPNKGSGGGTQRVQRLAYLEDGGAGSTTPSLGTTCPAASATIKSWIKVITSDGSTGYIPCWA